MGVCVLSTVSHFSHLVVYLILRSDNFKMCSELFDFSRECMKRVSYQHRLHTCCDFSYGCCFFSHASLLILSPSFSYRCVIFLRSTQHSCLGSIPLSQTKFVWAQGCAEGTHGLCHPHSTAEIRLNMLSPFMLFLSFRCALHCGARNK